MLLEQFYRCESYQISDENMKRLRKLKDDMEVFFCAYGQIPEITNAFRSKEEHIAIYKKKNAKRKEAGLPALPVPLGSKHLIACAIDLRDKDGQLKHFIEVNPRLMETIGLWWEDFEYTPDYVHLQNVKYPSWKPGKPRSFRPY